MTVLDLTPSSWTYLLDLLYMDAWEERRAFVERWLHGRR